MSPLTIIAAIDADRGIGLFNRIPWNLPEEMAHFRTTTTGGTVVMGHQTFRSIGRPLPKRRNIVLTRKVAKWSSKMLQPQPGIEIAHDLASALNLAETDQQGPIFIIGGARLYEEAMTAADQLVITHLPVSYGCRVFFPQIDPEIWRETTRVPLACRQLDDFAVISTYVRR